jgi:glycosyltransferase involved in cell wall biosynthesis
MNPMKGNPLVSIVLLIIIFRYLYKVIQTYLNQTDAHFEQIFLDDGSTDDSSRPVSGTC